MKSSAVTVITLLMGAGQLHANDLSQLYGLALSRNTTVQTVDIAVQQGRGLPTLSLIGSGSKTAQDQSLGGDHDH